MVKLVFFLKPESVIRRYTGARTLKKLIEEIPDLKFLCFEEFTPDKEFLAEQHYVEHKGKFFFDWLIEYISLGPIIVSIIETSEENIAKIREVLGPTKPEVAYEKAPKTIRAQYGIMGGVNVAHASDAVETAKRESEIWIKYLKEKLGVDISKADPDKVMEKINNYIFQYIDYPMVDPIRYRELIVSVIKDRSKRDAVRTKMAALLKKETDEKYDEKYLERLADLIIESSLLQK